MKRTSIGIRQGVAAANTPVYEDAYRVHDHYLFAGLRNRLFAKDQSQWKVQFHGESFFFP